MIFLKSFILKSIELNQNYVKRKIYFSIFRRVGFPLSFQYLKEFRASFIYTHIIISAMENAKEKKHLSKGKIALIQYSLIAVCAVGLGVGGGIILKKKLGPTEVDYSGFDSNSFAADAKALLREYEKDPNQDFTPAELVNIGLEKYRQCENSYSIGVGQASTIVNQQVRNFQIKNGNTYYEEQISKSSMVSLANRVVASEESATIYKGKAIEVEVPEYDGNAETQSSDEFKANWGKTLPEVFIYIISNDTVDTEKSAVTKKDGKIYINLELDPEIASYNYKIQMKTISNLSSLPTFEYLRHTYVFDNDMTLLQSKLDEKYVATMSGINATIVNDIRYYYHANEYIKIPEINEILNYSVEGEITYE